MKGNSKTKFLVLGGLIAAFYAVATYISAAMGLAYGGIQFRISEALTILPVFTPAAIPGLIIGCFIGNLGSPFGMVDVLLGTF
ncbi:MAG: QueT transporter family protein, partial [Acutalibacteraceae bacterium]|nr:QueT transporter family protein [Acutalibacteraceae bacterium]